MYIAKVIGTDIEVKAQSLIIAYLAIRQLAANSKISMKYIKR